MFNGECDSYNVSSNVVVVYSDGSFKDGIVSSSGVIATFNYLITRDTIQTKNELLKNFQDITSLQDLKKLNLFIVEEFQFFLDSPILSVHRNVSGEIFAVMYSIYYSYKQGYKNLVIFHDYEGLSKWASSEWKSKTEITKFYKEFLESYRKKGVEIFFYKVKSHNKDVMNNYVDKLAKDTLKFRILRGKFTKEFISELMSKFDSFSNLSIFNILTDSE